MEAENHHRSEPPFCGDLRPPAGGEAGWPDRAARLTADKQTKVSSAGTDLQNRARREAGEQPEESRTPAERRPRRPNAKHRLFCIPGGQQHKQAAIKAGRPCWSRKRNLQSVNDQLAPPWKLVLAGRPRKRGFLLRPRSRLGGGGGGGVVYCHSGEGPSVCVHHTRARHPLNRCIMGRRGRERGNKREGEREGERQRGTGSKHSADEIKDSSMTSDLMGLSQ